MTDLRIAICPKYQLTLLSPEGCQEISLLLLKSSVQMDDNGQRENGRHKADPYNKSLHTQWMMPQHQVKDPHTLKFMAIVAERDKAIQERNIALSEKRAALAERDMAFLHRDAAIAERNTAIMERDNAIATLEYARENGVNANSGTGCSPGCTTPHAVKHMHQQHQHQQHHQQHHQQQHFQHVHSQQSELSDSPYHHSREMHISEAYPISTNSEGAVKPPKPKRPKKEPKVQDTPAKKTPKSSSKNKKGGGEDLNKQLKVPKQQNEWRDEVVGGEDLNEQASETKHDEWKGQDLGLNLVAFDESTMPVPVCSCTGKYQQCYKWGNGGWQSACCTTTMSMYPLPVMENKRHARVGGRKMSGGVFNKLLSRLSADGHDLSVPLDLKDHWAKHGTNRYITIK